MAPLPISSIRVGKIDDVQELIKTKPNKVPERFIREANERGVLVSHKTHLHHHIPVVDLSKLSKPHTHDDFLFEILKLSQACEDWGFFQVINHGIEGGVVEGIEKVAKEFFEMPLVEKKKYPMEPGTVQGYGQAFIFSEDQKLDWCNMFALGVHPPSIRNPKLWPSKPARFRKKICRPKERKTLEERKMDGG